jgi:hypothetical protein
MDFREAIKEYDGQPITRQLLQRVLRDYKRPGDKILKLVREGKLFRVKRGIFIPGKGLDITPPSPYLLANFLLGPSYVSMETALSHWLLIPEKVFEIASATTKKGRIYQTPAGRFSYTHVPLPYFSFGIRSVSLAPGQSILIASPEKALCDKLVTTSGLLLRSHVQAKKWLTEDMRISRESLLNLDANKISEWVDAAPKKDSIRMMIKATQEL